jgi:hypothetical protein
MQCSAHASHKQSERGRDAIEAHTRQLLAEAGDKKGFAISVTEDAPVAALERSPAVIARGSCGRDSETREQLHRPSGPPSPVWGLVESRPALLRRRHPGTNLRRVWARRAVGEEMVCVVDAHEATASTTRCIPRSATGPPPAGRVPTRRVGVARRAQGRPEGPQFCDELRGRPTKLTL